ncbi:sigma-54 interaction domain-containing protein [Pragia fontium]|uniref:DNA-binding transcriptional response regulator, NtrC family, contains REC, AAA-type ATPase, and a Fis-type DNA-binding domains n=2 Tax=Pragia fontium TaxID=82985 RepID=A0AAJ4W7R2_9GAMM|nr:sigma-54 dependent transcriptional regulator [Pragia fontium]AKJ41370.1 Fis family transcriptional regulator [Pragia fontium]SFC02261.1 DNA-binding transcriptional response regulator, NtrC family, contains REC, AAA-type ATPase, and a Fis-type DNA-binding domains [Pragia fontium DSM 5563 = ATCC 49100]SUB81618.1 Nif-specific regulatory protein [Pragia fontium]VEJ54076.1 Nif-specific regulatory protein [Pragia fontium]GKX62927.1 sigma-54-dependent Fis family transcriptional regulator [Pragia f
MHLKSAISVNETTFVASAPSTISLFSLAKKVAKYNVPVLITGETGTGKECIAKYIHHHAFKDNAAPYIGVNCAAIPESMLEAMLFGYEKGAFTGAVNSVAGKFEQANGGTLLLDEIGDMPLSLQAKLLRVLQEQEVERLGSHKRIPLNIRLIASTNKSLETEIEEGRFRQDLFYRLSVVPIHITPLRERSEDILPLANRFIRKYGMFSAGGIHLSEEAQHQLQRYEWPGNVRELENVIQRGIIMSNDSVIQVTDLGLKINEEMPIESDAAPQVIVTQLNEPARHLKVRGRIAEYQYIVDLLKRHKGNKSKTAQFLGITPRALRYRLASMREQGIDVECFS